MRWLLLFILVCTEVIGADHIQDEAKKLEGTWAVVSAEGIDAPEDAVKQMKVIIRRETMHIMVPDEDKTKATLQEKEKATFKLDPSKMPKTLDLIKDPKRPVTKGIYELDGDTLKLVWRVKGPRPTEILTKRRPKNVSGAPTQDDDLIIMVLKKAQKP